MCVCVRVSLKTWGSCSKTRPQICSTVSGQSPALPEMFNNHPSTLEPIRHDQTVCFPQVDPTNFSDRLEMAGRTAICVVGGLRSFTLPKIYQSVLVLPRTTGPSGCFVKSFSSLTTYQDVFVCLDAVSVN